MSIPHLSLAKVIHAENLAKAEQRRLVQRLVRDRRPSKLSMLLRAPGDRLSAALVRLLRRQEVPTQLNLHVLVRAAASAFSNR